MSDTDLVLACARLRKIEKDLAFEVVESYEGMRAEDFANALVTLESLVRVVVACVKKGTTSKRVGNPFSSKERLLSLTLMGCEDGSAEVLTMRMAADDRVE